jgi:hypothetical protein
MSGTFLWVVPRRDVGLSQVEFGERVAAIRRTELISSAAKRSDAECDGGDRAWADDLRAVGAHSKVLNPPSRAGLR